MVDCQAYWLGGVDGDDAACRWVAKGPWEYHCSFVLKELVVVVSLTLEAWKVGEAWQAHTYETSVASCLEEVPFLLALATWVGNCSAFVGVLRNVALEETLNAAKEAVCLYCS